MVICLNRSYKRAMKRQVAPRSFFFLLVAENLSFLIYSLIVH